jgi:hypothetical protein
MYCIYTEPPEYIVDTTDKICLICWNSDEENNYVKYLKNIPQFVSLCDCNAMFHESCLCIWTSKSPSCPICRKPFSLFISKQQYYYKLGINNIIIICDNIASVIRITALLVSLNLSLFILINWLNLCVIYFFDWNLIFYEPTNTTIDMNVDINMAIVELTHIHTNYSVH